ncbi:MAG: MFS transporter [Dehalococcoidia bacterium]|nr:MFS transporter [Dehalococcoidia bacterium]
MPLNLNWKPRRVFYGWWVVVACFFISLYTGGVVFYGFTAFFEPLADKFNWSYAQISFAASLRGMETGLLAPLVGMLVDRWGPRRLLFSGAIITSLGLILLSRTTSLGMFYGAFVLLAIGLNACSSTVLMTAVAKWFRKKIGIATGIMLCGYGLSGLLIPVIVKLIDTYEWQKALTILSIGLLAVCLPMSLLARHKPEQYGYKPDGEAENTMIFNNNLAPAKIAEVNVGTRQAVKSRTFWHITLALLCQMLLLSAVITQVMPYLSSIGITRAKSSLIAMAIPVTSIGGRLGLGWLGDRLDKRRAIAGALALMCGGLLCFGFASSEATWLLVLFLILFGIGYGGTNTLRASAIAEFFGRSNFGAIHGIVIGIMMLGNIAGPPLAAWVFEKWGSYQPIWFVFAGLAVAAILAVITTPPVSSTTQPIDET